MGYFVAHGIHVVIDNGSELIYEWVLTGVHGSMKFTIFDVPIRCFC
jgi:hypothetical protein